MKISYLGLAQENFELKEEILNAVEKVIDSSQFILGDEVRLLEERLQKYLGVNHIVSVNSGTDALLLSLLAHNYPEGSEILTVSNSFFATANIPKFLKMKIKFIDINAKMLMDENILAEVVTEQTRMIIPVHLTGRPAAMDRIQAIAQKFEIDILEDCTQAIGAKWKNQPVGTFGTGAFSLHPHANLSACGDAGFISTNDEELYQTLVLWRNHGLKDQDHLEFAGLNSRLDELQAALLNVKLNRLDSFTRKRRRNAAAYAERLSDLVGRGVIAIPEDEAEEFSVYHTFVVRLERRDELQAFLAERNIETKIHYKIPIHLQEPYWQGATSLQKTELYSKQILSLPIHQHLKLHELDYVCEQIHSFYRDA